jgi:2-(1,2-epoxy-1,2-dihydrophenyl)acetyl-CoA isomerase
MTETATNVPTVRAERDEHDDTVVLVTLNRAERLNALSLELVRDLRTTLEDLDADPTVRVVVLTGAGRAFSAGADLRAEPMSADVVLGEYYNPLVRTMAGLGTPLVAAVNGVAAGAGMAISLACDLRVAAAGATFRMAFVAVGLVPDAGATWLLPRAIGTARAAEMALTGRPVDAAEALAWGLVNEVVPDPDVVARALDVGRGVAAQASSTGAIRLLLRDGADGTLEQALEAELIAQVIAQRGPDFAEALAAFADKRRPRFR